MTDQTASPEEMLKVLNKFGADIDAKIEAMEALEKNALVHLEKGNFDIALIEINRAIKIDPHEEQLLNTRKLILRKKNEHDFCSKGKTDMDGCPI